MQINVFHLDLEIHPMWQNNGLIQQKDLFLFRTEVKESLAFS